MDKQNDSRTLFDDLESGQIKVTPPQKWLMATNHMNLCHILSAGLITAPGGFRKYYQDPLSLAPGWIPVYADGLPAAAMELSTQERKTLRPCVLELDLFSLTGGPVRGVDRDNNLAQTAMAEAKSGAFTTLYIPAPLPLTIIRTIYFKTKEDRSAFEDVASQVNNVPTDLIPVKTSKNPFNPRKDPEVIPYPVIHDGDTRPDNHVQAVGGIAAMLAHIADRGDLALAIYQFALMPDRDPSPAIIDPMLAGLGPWILGRQEEIEPDPAVNQFWKTVDLLVESPADARAQTYLDNIPARLTELAESGSNQSLKNLAADLYQISGFTDQTLTELFEKHPSPSSRALILLFSGLTAAECLSFNHPLFTEQEKIYAAILYGARDGWMAQPLPLRNIPHLAPYLSHQMAALSHTHRHTGLTLNHPPTRPQSLRELLTPHPETGWTQAQKDAALHLARKMKWDCLETHIRLPKGDYSLKIDGQGLHLILQGDAPVETVVSQEVFFQKFGTAEIARKLEGAVREILKG